MEVHRGVRDSATDEEGEAVCPGIEGATMRYERGAGADLDEIAADNQVAADDLVARIEDAGKQFVAAS